MVFGGPLLKKRRPLKKMTAFSTETLKDIVVSHLIATSVIGENDDIEIILPEEFKDQTTIPLELRIYRNGIK